MIKNLDSTTASLLLGKFVVADLFEAASCLSSAREDRDRGIEISLNRSKKLTLEKVR